MVRQPQEIQTLYAEQWERLAAYKAARSFSSLSGSFATKRISGSSYWYFKTSETSSGQRECSVGPDTPATRSIIEAYQKGRAATQEVGNTIARLCAMLRQGGAMLTDTVSAKVISGLGSAGVFQLGAVLVGMQTKAAKDRQQAGEMIEVLIQDRPGDIELAIERMNRRAKEWRKKLRDGLERLSDPFDAARK